MELLINYLNFLKYSDTCPVRFRIKTWIEFKSIESITKLWCLGTWCKMEQVVGQEEI